MKMYRQLREEYGVDYGLSFQVLDHIYYSAHSEAIATIQTSKAHATHSSASSVVHPTSLDGLFQLMFVALTRGGNDTLQTMIPTRVGRLWISSLSEESSPTSLQVYTSTTRISKRSAQSHISALDCLSQALRIEVQDLEVTSISGHLPPPLLREEAERPCHYMSWTPDLDILSSQDFQKFCESSRQDEVAPSQWFNDVELLIVCFAAQALKSSNIVIDPKQRTPFLDRYVSWLQAKIDQYLVASSVEDRQQRKDLLQDKAYLEAVCARVDINKRGQLHVTIGKELHNILMGDTVPLELIFKEEDLLADFYAEMIVSSQALDAAACYLDTLVHKFPDLKFIEIGAGIETTTRALLRTLAVTTHIPFFKQFTFPDISPAFLEKARENLSEQKRLDFLTLDIEEDPCTQGFCEGQYNVLIASSVFACYKRSKYDSQACSKITQT